MELEKLLQPKERASFELRALYEAAGCRKYHMGQFEEYALYQENQSFLPSRQVITFTDLDGRLLALKPDVTLSIAKSAQPAPGQTRRFYYNENVYRPSAESGAFKEIAQMGLEIIGQVGGAETGQAVALAAQSLDILSRAMGPDWRLVAGHMGYISALLDAVGAPAHTRQGLLSRLRARSGHELRTAALDAGVGQAGAEALAGLLELSGPAAQVLPRAAAACRSDAMAAALVELRGALQALPGGAGGRVWLDLALSGEMEYYNGLIFQGYLQGAPRPALRGGRYDLLARKFTPGAGAVGFAVYLDELDRAAPPPAQSAAPAMLNIALPKGRLGDKVYSLLAEGGCLAPEDYNATRRLVVEDKAAGVRCFLVKPSDVAIYVEHGAADIGIVGKDILAESEADVYELLDTGLGRCRMCVAGPAGFADDPGRPLRVATKFTRIAKEYFARQGRDIEIIHLNGSIELAPILGLSDVIVDIVETGATLQENGLAVLTGFMPISARVIANKSSYQFKRRQTDRLLEGLRGAIARRAHNKEEAR